MMIVRYQCITQLYNYVRSVLVHMSDDHAFVLQLGEVSMYKERLT